MLCVGLISVISDIVVAVSFSSKEFASKDERHSNRQRAAIYSETLDV